MSTFAERLKYNIRYLIIGIIIIASIIITAGITAYKKQEMPKMGLFTKNEIVVFSDNYFSEKIFWKDKDGKPITSAYVLSESLNGVVEVYNPLTKESRSIHRQFLRSGESK